MDKIKKMIATTMEAVEFPLQIVKQKSGINMSYNFIDHYVCYDPERIREAIHELMIPISLENYIAIFTMHELGHAMDRDALMQSIPKTLDIFKMKKNTPLKEQYSQSHLLAMIIEEHEMNISFEETAWANAEKLNEKYQLVDRAVFAQLKSHSLLTYQRLYEEDLKVYQQMNKVGSEQSA